MTMKTVCRKTTELHTNTMPSAVFCNNRTHSQQHKPFCQHAEAIQTTRKKLSHLMRKSTLQQKKREK